MADTHPTPDRRAAVAPAAPRCRRCGRSSACRAGDPTGGFCSAGCALATLVPRDAEGNFPVNAALGAALGIGLLGFNQLLLASMVWAMPGVVTRWMIASLSLGAATALALLVAQWRAGADRPREAVVALVVALGWFAAFRRADLVLGLVLTAAYLLWSVRRLLLGAGQKGDHV